jgi:hypothetical protein
VLGRITAAIAAGWHDPQSGLVLPFTPRLAPVGLGLARAEVIASVVR